MDEVKWVELRDVRVVIYGGGDLFWAGPFLTQQNAEQAALTILSGNSKQSVGIYNLDEITDIVDEEIGNPTTSRLRLYQFILDAFTKDVDDE